MCPSVFSIEIPKDDARKLAMNFYLEKTLQSTKLNPGNFSISNELTISDQGQTLFYVFNLEANKGFVIVSAHDNVYPVLGYTTTGYYTNNNQPPAFSVMIENLKSQVLDAKLNNIQATPDVVSAWKQYSQKPVASSIKSKAIQALLFTFWDQGCFYNEQCPTILGGGLCNKANTGHLAVAMAQIMKYHNYPMHGTGSYSYNDPAFGTQSADFGNSTYVWATMPNFLVTANSEIAQVIYHSAVSVETQFSPLTSTANFVDAKDALINYFNYASFASYVERADYNDSIWINLMQTELDAGRPVLYSGTSATGNNYAFVCDGYDDNDLFHFNWGYGGNYNGYFLIANLNPGGGNVSFDQSAIIGISPASPLPIANFMADILLVPVDDPVQFTDLSIGNPISWDWNFGDGNTSNIQNPDHTYTNPGAYTVTLTITSADGIDTEVKTNYINVPSGVILNCGWLERASGFVTPYLGIDNISPVSADVVWASAFDNVPFGATAVQEYTVTTDGGNTWTPGSIPGYPDMSIANICAISDMQAWVALYDENTGGGNIMVTIDGGQNWIHQSSASFQNGSLAGVYLFDAFNGVAIGNVVDGYFQLYLTPDGGDFWIRIDSANIPYPMYNEAVDPAVFTTWDDTHVWFGTNRGRVFMTTDGGLNWTVGDIGANETVTSIAFKDANFGMLTTDNNNVVYRTNDGGQNWVTVTPQGQFFNTGLAYVPGTGGAYVSCGDNGSSFTLNDGGSWTLIDVEEHLAVSFFDDTYGWAGGTNFDSLVGGVYLWNPGTCFTQAVPLMPEFTSDKVNGCGGEVIEFYDASSPADITGWQWTITPATVTYVNGTDEFSQNPEVEFTGLGKYTVALEITTPYGNATVTKADYVTVVSSTIPFFDDFDIGSTDNFLLESASLADAYIDTSGVNSTNCLVFTGGNQNAGWSGNQNNTSANQAWNQNVTHHSRAYTCEIDATAHSSLLLSFDLRQTYSYGAVYTWFRVLINDTIQIDDLNGDMNFNPNSSGNDPFETKEFDISNWGGTVFTITLQAACKYSDDFFGSGQSGNNYCFVDNLSVSAYVPLVNDAGVTAIIAPTGGICGSLCGSLSTPVEVEITNFGVDTLIDIPVKVSVEDPMGFVVDFYDTITGPLASNNTAVAQMGDVNTTLFGTYLITAYTQLSTDQDNTNDTTYGSFYILHDAGVTAIIAPTGGICGSPATPVEVEITNFGTDTLIDIPVKVSVEDPMGFVVDIYDTIAGPLAPNTNVLAQMGDVNTTLLGTFMVTAYTQLPFDTDNSNDTTFSSFNTIDAISTFPFLEDFNNGTTDYFQLLDAKESIIQINNTGVGGTMGLNFQGGANVDWQGSANNTNANNAWNDNVLHQASAMTCNVDATSLTSLRLSFDLKQWYGYVWRYCWFRVVINGTDQIMDIDGVENFNPFTENSDPFALKVFDLSAYAGNIFTLTLQSANKYSDTVFIPQGFPNGDNAFVDNVRLYVPDDIDMGVSAVDNPTGSDCGNIADSVWLTVKNYGVVRQWDIPVIAGAYDPFGVPTVLNTMITDTIEPGGSLMVNMGALSTMIGGVYQIGGFTSMPGDNNPNNDTAGVLYTSVGPIFNYPFTEDFQTGMSTYFILDRNSRSNIYYDLEGTNWALRSIGNGSQQGWQGQGGSVTPDNAWNDNTTKQSTAMTCTVDPSSVSSLLLSFDLRQLNTYEYTDYSWFRLLLNDTLQLSDVTGVTNFMSSTSLSDPYRSVFFDLTPYVTDDFTLTFHACCKYDSTRSYQEYPEGDAVFIDNINMHEKQPNDAGVIAIISPATDLYCGLANDSIVVEVFNFGTDTLYDVPVTFSMTDPSGFVNTTPTSFVDTLPPLTSTELYMGLIDIILIGHYTTKAYTSVLNDIISINDTAYGEFSISLGVPIPFIDDFQAFFPLDNWVGDMDIANTGDDQYMGKFMTNPDTVASTIYANAMTNIKIGPIHANSYLLFDYVIWDTNYYAYYLQTGEAVQVSVIDCQQNVSTILIMDEAHQVENPHFAHRQFPLSAFVDQDLFIGFEVTAKDNDFYFYVDNVKIVDAPMLDLGPDVTDCDVSTIILNAGIPDAYYTWYDENFQVYSNEQTLSVDSTGIGIGSKLFYLLLTDQNGIQVTDSITVTFIDCSGIDELGLDKYIQIYPNPSDGLFFIMIKEINEPLGLSITNAHGQIIYDEKLIPDTDGSIHEIDLSSLARGVYFVKIRSSESTMNRKIVIQ